MVEYANGNVAYFLMYQVSKEKDTTDCAIPVFGYGAKKSRLLHRLFARLAREVGNGKTRFSIHLYANDLET